MVTTLCKRQTVGINRNGGMVRIVVVLVQLIPMGLSDPHGRMMVYGVWKFSENHLRNFSKWWEHPGILNNDKSQF